MYRKIAAIEKEKRQIDLLGLIMLGIGGAIGSGIFVASGIPIRLAGPGVVFVFLLAGIINMLVLMMLAEMSVAEPVSGSFSIYAEEYLGDSMGFISGWGYWTAGILSLATEMVAAAMITRWWFPTWPVWLFSLIILVLVTGIGLLDAQAFARAEEWLSFIKAGVLLLITITGVIILVGWWPGFPSPGWHNYLGYGGIFPNGGQGLLAALLLVIYTFAGGQVIGLAMGDTKEPARIVPRAVNTISFGLLFLYLGSIMVLVGLNPWNTIPQNGSVFVPVFQRLGLPGIAGLMNAVILSAVLSAMNSNMFGVPRMLRSLAERREAPAFLDKADRRGVPVPAVIVSAIFLLMIVGLTYFLPEQVFTYLASASGVTILLNWAIITAAHLSFRRHPGPDKDGRRLRYRGYPYTNYFVLISLVVVLGMSVLNLNQLVGLIAGLGLFGLYGLLFYIIKK